MALITIIFPMNRSTLINCLLLLLLNTINSCLGTIRTIFVAKKAGKITYFITFIDASMYAIVLKSMSSEGYYAVLAYVLGKVFGAMLGDYIESKIAIGINDIILYVNTEEKMLELQEKFLKEGYSSTANIGLIHDDKNRYSLNIQIARKDMSRFYRIIDKAGIEEPTMLIKEVKGVTGKIAERV